MQKHETIPQLQDHEPAQLETCTYMILQTSQKTTESQETKTTQGKDTKPEINTSTLVQPVRNLSTQHKS